MSAPCSPDHVLREPLPDGLALYPFGRLSYEEDDWFADEASLAHVDRLDGPKVYLDMGTVGYISSTRIAEILRLAERAHGCGGRVVLCGTKPEILEVFQAVRSVTPPWLEFRAGGMPGGGLPEPAWLSWGGGVVAVMARSFGEGQDLELMPVLADALEEAGCTLRDVLDHCRGPGPHVRGCWVVRLLLGSK